MDTPRAVPAERAALAAAALPQQPSSKALSPSSGALDAASVLSRRWSPRRPLTKYYDGRRWLRNRSVQWWCELEGDALVYYGSSEGSRPRGRIPLRGCHLSVLGAAGFSVQPAALTVRLLRPGKSTCELQLLSQCDVDDVVAGIEGRPACAATGSTPSLASGASSGPPSLPDSCGRAAVPPLRGGPPSKSAPALFGRGEDEEDAVVADELWLSHECIQPVGVTPGSSPSQPSRGHVSDGPQAGPAELPRACALPIVNLDTLQGHGDRIFDVDEPLAAEAGRGPASDADGDWAMPEVSCEDSTQEALPKRGPCLAAPELDAAGLALPSAQRVSGPLLSPSGRGSAGQLAEAHRRATALIWRFQLREAAALLEPYRRTQPWHAAAFAECAFMEVLVTLRLDSAAHALALVAEAEALLETVSRRGSTQSDSYKVIGAELLLLRSALQVVLGARFRALYNLRLCWQAYQRLEHAFGGSAGGGAAPAAAFADCGLGDIADIEDLRGRLAFGMGFFWLATSLLPTGLGPLLRLAGFVMDRERGKACLGACAEQGLGTRAVPAAICLAMLHLDLEPDIARAGQLLVCALERVPENPLLHWAGSVLAWRNCCLEQAADMTSKAMLCCGPELGQQALIFRYELGIINLARMRWTASHSHLEFVCEILRTERVFFMYRMLVPLQLAAASFQLGRDHEGSALLAAVLHAQEFRATSAVEGNFAQLARAFLEHRVEGRRLLAFEVLYFLRQLPRLPPETLGEMLRAVRQLAAGWAAASEQVRRAGPGQAPGEALRERFVEHIGARVVECVLLFYLGDLDAAMAFVPALVTDCDGVPESCSYLTAHGLYWCGRILALAEQPADAGKCLRRAKAVKGYPFNIHKKISAVLAEVESSDAAR